MHLVAESTSIASGRRYARGPLFYRLIMGFVLEVMAYVRDAAFARSPSSIAPILRTTSIDHDSLPDKQAKKMFIGLLILYRFLLTNFFAGWQLGMHTFRTENI